MLLIAGALPETLPVEATIILNDKLSYNGISINKNHFTYFYLSENYEDILSIPDAMAADTQIKVEGYDFPVFRIVSGNALSIDSYGNFKPAVYSFGETKSGITVVDVICGDVTFEVTVEVQDYAEYYVYNTVDKYITDHISDDMTDYEKVVEACKFVASYDYGSSASMYGMVLRGYGDCWAATDTICYFCDKLNIPAVAHSAPNSISSTHYNALVQIDGVNYIAEAGYSGKAPRSYNVTAFKPYTELSDGTLCLSSFADWNSESYIIPETYEGKKITKIGREAFAYCKNLKEVSIPKTVTTIDEKAFYNSGITSITIPETVESVGKQAFSECDNLESVKISGNPKFDYSVFYSCDSLENIVLSDKMEALPLGFLADCYSLRNIVIPDSVTFIESQAFRSYYTCTRNLYIPPSVAEISDETFYDTTRGLTIYGQSGSYAEIFATKMEIDFVAVNSPKDMPIISEEALFPLNGVCGENAVWNIDVKTGIMTISGTGPMNDYESYNDQPWVGRRSQIKKVVVEEGITRLGDYTFMYCENAADFDLPSTLESIGKNVFWNTAAKTIELPENIKSIGYFSFMCSSIEEITFPSKARLSGGVFQSGEHLISAVLEKGITYIPYNMFNGAYVLNYVDIPNTVTGIGEYSFCECESLSNITIPSSVTSIGTNAFYKCDNLRYVVIPETVTRISSHAFGFSDYDDKTESYIKKDDFKIYGYPGSEAERYALENGIDFAPLSRIKGDANMDGKVNIADVVMLQKWILGAGDLTCWQNVDLCQNNQIDVFDLVMLKRMLLS